MMFKYNSLYTGRRFWLSLGDACRALGDNILTDGDMEAVGVAAWPSGSSAIITKQTNTPAYGKQCLRIAYNGVNDPFTYQNVFLAGQSQLVTGYAKGDGTAAPKVAISTGSSIWTGTTSTQWQQFEVIESSASGNILFYAVTSAAGTYAEFDQITVKRNFGIVVDEYGIEGTGSIVAPYAKYSNQPRFEFPSTFNATGTTTLAFNFRAVDASVFSALVDIRGGSALDYFTAFTYNNTLLITSRNGLSYGKQTPSLSNNTWHRCVVTKTTGQTQSIYINGVDVTVAAVTSLAQPTSYTIGKRGASSYPFNGDMSNIGVWNRILTSTEIALDYSTNKMTV